MSKIRILFATAAVTSLLALPAYAQLSPAATPDVGRPSPRCTMKKMEEHHEKVKEKHEAMKEKHKAHHKKHKEEMKAKARRNDGPQISIIP